MAQALLQGRIVLLHLLHTLLLVLCALQVLRGSVGCIFGGLCTALTRFRVVQQLLQLAGLLRTLLLQRRQCIRLAPGISGQCGRAGLS